MVDFTSALYLGFHHDSKVIEPWRQLTTGVPAALKERKADVWLANQVANMQGLERGILAPSSLHLFWDVMGRLGKEALVLADDKVYQIARWGLERAACHGASVIFFNHHNSKSLEQQLKRQCTSHYRMVVVLTDGWCPHCGKAAPLPQYLALARKHNGFLLIDDTQALGVLGKSPTKSMPYGEGGGGLLQWFGLRGQDIVTICSLAKGFGVPVSVMSGSASWTEDFVRQSKTRVHCSPVSVAHVHAALHALSDNRKHGKVLRQKLLQNVTLFRKTVSRLGFSTRGSIFPVQTLLNPLKLPPQVLYQKLSEKGVKSLLLEPHESKEPGVSFCLSASHTTDQLRRTAGCLSQVRNFVTQLV